MDIIKIGRFIAERRKGNKLTQAQLAEKLGITDRAVSKWETGRSLPDASIMQELCAVLGITVNDLICGEEVSMKNDNGKYESTIIELVKQKEEADRRLLRVEAVMVCVSMAFMIVMTALAVISVISEKPLWVFFLLFGIGFVQLIVVALTAVRIEQVAGYYKCAKCGHTYTPSYKAVNLAAHVGRTRYMKCPNCGKKSWQTKVLNKD